MKNKLNYSIIALLSLFVLNCENENKLEGGFSSYNPEYGYVEMYFKKDSMRLASDNNWVLF
ncbi:MAG: hypothetical protein HKP48_00935 [Winogradskyella sp.]|uniref:hypothetical protein n=1 Tax=Winogradskyella sp. TaxID=1883156 RepID=UPI0017928D8A|nr:hypothetical protein [Winogradskyella sp.]MBT8245751.1 hypothetical protein [Winogradskyella sp.]NNK21882.1 hypothetical protein [Winogradskyella sp.]